MVIESDGTANNTSLSAGSTKSACKEIIRCQEVEAEGESLLRWGGTGEAAVAREDLVAEGVGGGGLGACFCVRKGDRFVPGGDGLILALRRCAIVGESPILWRLIMRQKQNRAAKQSAAIVRILIIMSRVLE